MKKLIFKQSGIRCDYFIEDKAVTDVMVENWVGRLLIKEQKHVSVTYICVRALVTSYGIAISFESKERMVSIDFRGANYSELFINMHTGLEPERSFWWSQSRIQFVEPITVNDLNKHLANLNYEYNVNVGSVRYMPWSLKSLGGDEWLIAFFDHKVIEDGDVRTMAEVREACSQFLSDMLRCVYCAIPKADADYIISEENEDDRDEPRR